MNKEKRLLKNIGLFTIGNASVKILSFLLVPLYTNILSTEEFGIYELVLTTVNLLVPIATLDISDSALRFSLDPDVDHGEVYKISFKYCFVGFIFVISMLSVNRFFTLVTFLIGNETFFSLIFLGYAIDGILISYAKGVDRVKDTAVSGVVGAFVTIILNIILLLPMKMGIRGYFIATVIGLYVQVIYLMTALKGTHNGYGFVKNRKLEKAVLWYSIPLIANNTAWWMNSALDRYIVTYFRGISENGVYSVSYKIPTIINTVQSLFQQAWTLSAIQEYKTEEAHRYFVKMYRNYNFLLVSMCGFLILFNRILARIMYANGFYDAWRYVPFLCIGFVFVGLSNYIGGIFNALKKVRIIAGTTILGAVVNCILNIILIPGIGAMGAAIATCASYFVIWVVRISAVKEAAGIGFFSIRDIISYGVLIMESMYTVFDGMVFDLIKIAMAGILIVLYWGEIKGCINMGFKMINNGTTRGEKN